MNSSAFPQHLLSHHGDIDAQPGLLDFAVNVHGTAPPEWLIHKLQARLPDLARYPQSRDSELAAASVAALHHRDPADVMLLSGAAELFSLLPCLTPRHAALCHPSFTEPDAALTQAGVEVTRVIATAPFDVDPNAIPLDADLVVVGNPTNPTSRLHSSETIRALCRPGRIVIVDEAFMDVVDGHNEASVIEQAIPGLVVLRSLTKTWGLAGLRAGYAVGDPKVLAQLERRRPQWPVSTLTLEAITACTGERAAKELAVIRRNLAAQRIAMTDALTSAGIRVAIEPAAPFVLVKLSAEHDPQNLRELLRQRGIAVRRADTFPGLDSSYIRLAVRPAPAVHTLIEQWQIAREIGQP